MTFGSAGLRSHRKGKERILTRDGGMVVRIRCQYRTPRVPLESVSDFGTVRVSGTIDLEPTTRRPHPKVSIFL